MNLPSTEQSSRWKKVMWSVERTLNRISIYSATNTQNRMIHFHVIYFMIALNYFEPIQTSNLLTDVHAM